MITLARRESREVEPGPGQHGHAAEAALACVTGRPASREPVQVPGDGSEGNPERRGKLLCGRAIPRFEEQHQGEEAVPGSPTKFSGIATSWAHIPARLADADLPR
jgi:hypothetical protein